MSAESFEVIGSGVSLTSVTNEAIANTHSLVKSASISASHCIPAVNACEKRNSAMKPEANEQTEDLSHELNTVRLKTDSMVAGLTRKVAAMPSGVAHS